MKNFSVCLSPYLLPIYELEQKTVVVADILRATSCMVTAIACGVERFIPFEKVEDCRQMGQQGFLRGGERNSVRIDGFELGNSPFDYMELQGKKVAMTTTNGTQAIHQSAKAKQVLIGAFLNLSALADFVAQQNNDVLVVCAARKNIPNLEDTLFAGALAHKLKNTFLINDDNAQLARYLFENNQNDIQAFVSQATHYQRLSKIEGLERDLDFCFNFDVYDSVPIFAGEQIVQNE